MQGKRVLGRVRLSRTSEESTSIERQREIIEAWAKANGHQVIGWAEDLDVSGGVDPFDTPALGPWLKDRHDEWDILAAWKLDRIARRTIPMNKLFGWLQDHHKTLVSVSENIDLSTWVGRMVAGVIAGVAEGELEAIKERTKSSRAKLRQKARWHGGKPPFGYRVIKNPDGDGKTLELDPEAAAVVRRIVDAALSEYPLTRLAIELTEEGVPTPKNHYMQRPGGQWSSTVLRQILRSKALLGYVHHTVHATDCKTRNTKWCREHCSHGETVRDDNGEPLRMADEALVTIDEFNRVQARLDLIQKDRANAKPLKLSALAGVAICLECTANLHHDTTRVGKYTYHHYRCRPCSVMVKAEFLEAEVEKEFLTQLGDVPVRERVWVPGDSRESELSEAVTAYDEVLSAAGRAKSATAKQRLQNQLDALDARIAELESAPKQGARWEYRPTGQTYRSVWETADTDQRRNLLTRSGITATASAISCRLNIPPEIVSAMEGQPVPGIPTIREVVTPVKNPDPAIAAAFRSLIPQEVLDRP